MRLLNPITKIYWAGWQSTTYDLQRAGWELSAHQDIVSACIQMIIKHTQMRLYGVSQKIPYRFYDDYKFDSGLEIAILQMSSQLSVTIPIQAQMFEAIETMPQYVEHTPKDIEDFKIFKPVGGQEILIEQPNVTDLMEKILKIQAPKQAELREKRRKEIRRMMNETGISEGAMHIGYDKKIEPRKDLVAQLISVK